jgi:MtN3 and saliva related transmembrane protein
VGTQAGAAAGLILAASIRRPFCSEMRKKASARSFGLTCALDTALYSQKRMTAIITDLVGYVAVVVGTSLMLPQVLKSLQTKKMDDVSFGTVALYFFNCLLWLIYSWMIRAWPPVVANAIGLAISVVQIRLKMLYG